MFQKTNQAKSKTSIGRFGEELAANYLQKKGYTILSRNYFLRGSELDIICKKNGILVFVEVKTRRSNRFGSAEEAWNRNKKQKILRGIRQFLSQEFSPEWRLDLIAIQLSKTPPTLKHFQNILLT